MAYITHNVEIEIDEEEFMDDYVGDNLLKSYYEERFGKESYDYNDIVNDYYHGDFNLKLILDKIGIVEVNKVLNN